MKRGPAGRRLCLTHLQRITLVYADLGSMPPAGAVFLATLFSFSLSLSFLVPKEGDRSFQLDREPTACHWASAMGESQALPLRSSGSVSGQLGKEMNYNTAGRVP